MSRYRHRPTTVHAWRVEGSWFDDGADAPLAIARQVSLDRGTRQVFCNTRHGLTRASVGDWIILGATGEVYPCPDDTFRASYEPDTPPGSSIFRKGSSDD